MVLETDPYKFASWFQGALLDYAIWAGLGALVALVICFLIAAFRHGPLAGGDLTFKVTMTALADLLHTSPRRVWALARLAVQESIRRKVFVAFTVFLLILMFAGWFLDNSTVDPGALYLSFVLTATTYLVLLMGLFLSVFSLPADIKSRTIYTIVTKPVRAGEIVLGRILGFTIVGTVMLAVMGLVSYVFVIRLLDHTHEVDITSLETRNQDGEEVQVARTSSAQGHRHHLTLRADGSGSTDIQNGHWHEVSSETRSGKTTYTLSGPRGLFNARVPVYGDIGFRDRTGKGVGRGISVGKEWTYRSFVEGGTAAAAIWTFHDVTPDRFPDGLPLEMTIRVFRSHKGVIDQGVGGSLVAKNPKTGRSSALDTFTAKDVSIDRREIPRALKDPSGKPLDLFDDLAPNGDVEIWVQCMEAGQYYGMAKADLYLHSRDASFALNFVKGYLGIWLQMVMVIAFGVMFSTFLSGPVAMLATVSIVIVGFFSESVFALAAGKTPGGGPLESAIRIAKQQNVVIDMEEGLSRTVVQTLDNVVLFIMKIVASVVPNFSEYMSTVVSYVAKGFDIPGDTLAVLGCRAVGLLVVLFIVGYFFLKTREVAR